MTVMITPASGRAFDALSGSDTDLPDAAAAFELPPSVVCQVRLDGFVPGDACRRPLEDARGRPGPPGFDVRTGLLAAQRTTVRSR